MSKTPVRCSTLLLVWLLLFQGCAVDEGAASDLSFTPLTPSVGLSCRSLQLKKNEEDSAAAQAGKKHEWWHSPRASRLIALRGGNFAAREAGGHSGAQWNVQEMQDSIGRLRDVLNSSRTAHAPQPHAGKSFLPHVSASMWCGGCARVHARSAPQFNT